MYIFVSPLSRFLVYLVVTIGSLANVNSLSSKQPIPSHQTLYELKVKEQTDRILFFIQKRLSVMHEVARTKWNLGLAIEDLPREGQLLERLCQQGREMGLDPQWVRIFFQAQFDAAKMIQKNDFKSWSQLQVQTFDEVLDLKEEIRPYLDMISNELLLSLARIHSETFGPRLSPYILSTPLTTRDSDAIDEDVWQQAISPLLMK